MWFNETNKLLQGFYHIFDNKKKRVVYTIIEHKAKNILKVNAEVTTCRRISFLATRDIKTCLKTLLLHDWFTDTSVFIT